ncbi:macro domain-containing protein [Salipiger sp. CCB-MM3]|uniref:macro domain-containing protein n=1 Tax=Salipiger sp. CCB-MM3 TaxID=1792508 RepID=UPI0009F3EED6|nr:macro domain-containing protein [Salipiger sp. CCB-MM3]
MINYRRSDIFTSDAQTLVNTVNCVGVMGKGIAKEFKKREPEMFLAYKEICDKKLLTPGKLWLWRQSVPWILNFPTKNHWKGPSKIEWIEAGLDKFAGTFREKGITSISFPRLGCGNGGLDWETVRPVMEHYLDPLPIPIYIHGLDGHQVIPEHFAIPDESYHRPTNFDDFKDSISNQLASDQGKRRSILDGLDYEAIVTPTGEVAISVNGVSHLISDDDLRGVWINIQSGQISHRDAEWFNADLRGCFIDVLARLPFTSASVLTKSGEDVLSVSFAQGASQTATSPDQISFV